MSGACAAASLVSATPLPPLQASVILSTGASSFGVSGASGDIYTQGNAVISANASGGTGSYSESISAVSDGGNGSGQVFITAASDGIHNTVGWSGMAVGETRLFHLKYQVSDGVSSKTATAPDTGVFAINRSS